MMPLKKLRTPDIITCTNERKNELTRINTLRPYHITQQPILPYRYKYRTDY